MKLESKDAIDTLLAVQADLKAITIAGAAEILSFCIYGFAELLYFCTIINYVHSSAPLPLQDRLPVAKPVALAPARTIRTTVPSVPLSMYGELSKPGFCVYRSNHYLNAEKSSKTGCAGAHPGQGQPHLHKQIASLPTPP